MMANNGCEYCRYEKEILKDEYWEIGINKRHKRLEVVFDGNYEAGDTCFYLDFCMRCGRNLKTGNEMIEIKPLEFPRWEEFRHGEKVLYYDKLKYTISIINDGNEIILNKFNKEETVYKQIKIYKLNNGNYKLVQKEIERIRKEFIIGLAGGSYEV